MQKPNRTSLVHDETFPVLWQSFFQAENHLPGAVSRWKRFPHRGPGSHLIYYLRCRPFSRMHLLYRIGPKCHFLRHPAPCFDAWSLQWTLVKKWITGCHKKSPEMRWLITVFSQRSLQHNLFGIVADSLVPFPGLDCTWNVSYTGRSGSGIQWVTSISSGL